MASSRARYQRNIVLGLVLVFLVLLIPYVAFADNGIRLTIDYANGATIFIQDNTAGGPPIEITDFTSPYTYTDVISGHEYSVWVTRGGFRLLVKNWPNDWTVDATGTVATGTWAGGTEPVHFSGPGTGNIIVKKETDPDGSSESFTFTPSYGSNFNLSDGGSNDSGELGSGTYTVSESVQNGWALTNIVDTDPDGGTTSSGNEATIDLDGGETITVTFSNTKVGGYVTITPGSATNEVGQEHTFLITAYATGAVPDSWLLTAYPVAPAPGPDSVTLLTPTGTPDLSNGGLTATWYLKINNSAPGQFTASATVDIVFDAATTLTRET
jgi:hypothetical protein